MLVRVVVDRLRGQLAQPRQHPLREPLEHRVGRLRRPAQLRGPQHVPAQHPVEPGVLEARERRVEPRHGAPEAAQRLRAARRRGPRLAGQPGEHPRPAAAVERRRAHEPRRGDDEPGRGDVLHRRVLEVEHGRLEAGRVQLQHVVADPVVAVGLARQRRRLAREPEPLGRESGVVGRGHAPIMADPARG